MGLLGAVKDETSQLKAVSSTPCKGLKYMQYIIEFKDPTHIMSRNKIILTCSLSAYLTPSNQQYYVLDI